MKNNPNIERDLEKEKRVSGICYECGYGIEEDVFFCCKYLGGINEDHKRIGRSIVESYKSIKKLREQRSGNPG